jgi:HPt (histidine-containing phosphotransfer) domain-containing protein
MSDFNYNDAIQMLRDNLGEEEAQKLIDEFTELVEQAIDDAEKALKNQDYEEFGRQCHTIKSNAGILGENELENICVQIDDCVYNENFEKIKNYGDEFLRLAKDLKARI